MNREPSNSVHDREPGGSVEVSADRGYTTKQMGDACEMLIAAELTLHGIPAIKVPDNWPGYDVIAQPPGKPLQKISVKARTFSKSGNFVAFNDSDDFDWLAIVILPNESAGLIERCYFIVPRLVAWRRSYCASHRQGRGFFVNKLIEKPPSPIPPGPPPSGGWGVADFRDNFNLLELSSE